MAGDTGAPAVNLRLIRTPASHLRVAGSLLAAISVLAFLAGCGGGGTSGGATASGSEVAAKVDAACAKLNGYSVWLPEHLAKEHLSIAEGEAEVRKASDSFRSTLEGLAPPDELRTPLAALEKGSSASATSKPAIESQLRKNIGFYGEVGAERCAKELRAAILVVGGAAVTDAYRQEGLRLPPKPAGW